MLQERHEDGVGHEAERFEQEHAAVHEAGAHGFFRLRFQRGHGGGDGIKLLRQELEHEHRHLVGKERFDVALGPHADRDGQDVAGAGAAHALMQPVQFDHGSDGVKLGVTQHAAELRAIGPDAGRFLDGELFDAITLSQWSIRPPPANRARGGLAELVHLQNVFLNQSEAFLERLLRALRNDPVGGRQGNVIASDHGEEMLGAVGVHERVRPGEEDVHAAAVAFDEIEAQQFAAFQSERIVADFFAEARPVAVHADLRQRRSAARQFPFRQKNSAGPRAEEGITGDEIGEPFAQGIG